MKWRSGHNPMNHMTGPAPVFSKMYAVFGFLLIVLAALVIPCSAADTMTNDAGRDAGMDDSAPAAVFVSTPSLTDSQTVIFTDQSTGMPIGWTWFFGDEDYSNIWTQQNGGENWLEPRHDFAAVAMANDSRIVIMGGLEAGQTKENVYHNDVRASGDLGKTWGRQDIDIGWSARRGMTAVVLPDNGIVLMAGREPNGDLGDRDTHDVYWSGDYGRTFSVKTREAPWNLRSYHAAVALSDGSIVLMGGKGILVRGGNRNDVWISRDRGTTWTQQTPNASWPARAGASAVSMPDDSIVLMAGTDGTQYFRDVWISRDRGTTWTQQTGNAPWSARTGASAVSMPDGSIVLMAGTDSATGGFNDVWRSVDMGQTWTQVTSGAGWSQRSGQSAVSMPDGSIILIDGKKPGNRPVSICDTWRQNPAGSSLKNPTHTYAAPGTYTVTLQVYNSRGISRIQKNITVSSNSNVVVFGNTQQLVHGPSGPDYRLVGGSSAIRRNGSMDTFIGNPKLEGNDWVQVTNGAAITGSGNLVTWTPVSGADQTDVVVTHEATPDKKYVGISQFSDWLLAIYEDGAGLTHLEAIANPASPPAAVVAGLPTGTGWKMVAAGNNHALALKSDGSLVAWGDNPAHQLELPTDKKYADIDAGMDFSIGLTAIAPDGTGGRIYAAGRDDYGQVSGAPKEPGKYIQIEAGTSTGATLTHNGTIVTWGKNLPGIPVPTDADYTAISLSPETGFAIKEPMKEIHITGPLSPGKPIPNAEDEVIDLPMGSTIEHTENDVTRIFDQHGKQIAWGNNLDAKQILSPAGMNISGMVVHYVPSGSIVDSTTKGKVVVSDPASDQVIFTVIENGGGDGYIKMPVDSSKLHNLTIPAGVCYAGTGCSVSNSAKHHLFMSQPFSPEIKYGTTYSVEYIGDNNWVGYLRRSDLDSSGNSEFTHLISRKMIDSNISQPTQFSVINGNRQAWVVSTATISSTLRSYTYSVDATSTDILSKLDIAAKLKDGSDNNLSTKDQSFPNSNGGTVSETFSVSGTGSYYTKGAVTYKDIDGIERSVIPDAAGPSKLKELSGSWTHKWQDKPKWCASAVGAMIANYHTVDHSVLHVGTMMHNPDGTKGTTPDDEKDYYIADKETGTDKGGLGKKGTWIGTSGNPDFVGFSYAKDEIDSNRPLKYGKSSHARAVIGYKTENNENRLIFDDPKDKELCVTEEKWAQPDNAVYVKD
jgi:PKD repeat protein